MTHKRVCNIWENIIKKPKSCAKDPTHVDMLMSHQSVLWKRNQKGEQIHLEE